MPFSPQRLVSARRRLGLTQQELAVLTETHTATIQAWESGRYIPKVDKLEPLSSALDVPIGHFFESEEVPNV